MLHHRDTGIEIFHRNAEDEIVARANVTAFNISRVRTRDMESPNLRGVEIKFKARVQVMEEKDERVDTEE